MINNDSNVNGIYRAVIINRGTLKVYVPSIATFKLFENNSLTIIEEVYEKCKNTLPSAQWCVPNMEAMVCDEIHQCWVVFECGDYKRPIIMGFVGKGIKYHAINSNSGGTSGGGSNSGNNPLPEGELIVSGDWIWPVTTTSQSSGYGWRIHPIYKTKKFHNGTDIPVGTGTQVHAASSGTVITATFSSSAGNMVVIDHGNGVVTKYFHNSELKVSAGQTVNAGQVIALSGSTGNSTGPHLHYEVWVNGQTVDPRTYNKS